MNLIDAKVIEVLSEEDVYLPNGSKMRKQKVKYVDMSCNKDEYKEKFLYLYENEKSYIKGDIFLH